MITVNGMTRPLKTPPRTASRAIFLRGKRRFTSKKARKTLKMPPAVAYRGIFFKKKYAVKEPDPETGLYYYGARYLDPKTGRWLSGDPALGEYFPSAPLGDEEKKRNQSLPGMGGIFNTVNMHAYHYAGNNPVKYVDPDGRDSGYIADETAVMGFGHAGWFVKTDEGYSFFEVIGLPRNLKAGDTYREEDGETETLVLSNSYESLGSMLLAKIGGQPSSAGTVQRNFSDKEKMLEFISASFKGNANIYEFNTSGAEDKAIYNASIEKGKNFQYYAILGNSCGTLAMDVLTTRGSGLFKPISFGFGQTLNTNGPNAIGNELFFANHSRAAFYSINKKK
jgi:RHS repeat-associated protein